MDFLFSWCTNNFLKCCLEMANLEKLIFVNKNWLNDPKLITNHFLVWWS